MKNGFIHYRGWGIACKMYFVVNHSQRYLYRLSHWRETFDEIMDINSHWNMSDDFDYLDDEIEPIEQLLNLGYATNLGVYELPIYIRNPEILVCYMDRHGFGLYDISRAINTWEANEEKYKQAQTAVDSLIAEKNELNYMDTQDDDIMMLCETMKNVM